MVVQCVALAALAFLASTANGQSSNTPVRFSNQATSVDDSRFKQLKFTLGQMGTLAYKMYDDDRKKLLEGFDIQAPRGFLNVGEMEALLKRAKVGADGTRRMW